MTVQPYLYFGGRCEEAIKFYEKTIGAEVTMLMRFNESPEPHPPGAIEAGFENKIMHCSLKIGDSTIMASDGCNSQVSKFAGFSLALTAPTAAEAQKKFAALAEGGEVQMPLTKTFFSPSFGMLVDRFGLGWTVLAMPEH